ncbi:MAG TPA: hypothetical protein VJN48_15125 [Terriglobales bacterium]|nr:hypothetical protein [Terriglobales bacterium]
MNGKTERSSGGVMAGPPLEVCGRWWPASRRGVRRVTAVLCVGSDNAAMRATSEKEAHENASHHIEDELLFQDRHPELAAYLSEIEGTYARCQGRAAQDLESACEHVFHACSWCAEEFEQLRKLKQSFVG